MIDVNIRAANLRQIEKKLGKFKSKAPMVLSRAINRTVSNVQKNMAKETSSLYYVTSSDVRKTIKSVKANKGSLKAKVTSKGSRRPLIKFKVSPKTPVKNRGGKVSPSVYRAGVRKDSGMKALNGNPKPFIATIGSTQVFERFGSDRFPVGTRTGPAVPQMVKNDDVMDVVNKDANETLRRRINAEVNHILRG